MCENKGVADEKDCSCTCATGFGGGPSRAVQCTPALADLCDKVQFDGHRGDTTLFSVWGYTIPGFRELREIHFEIEMV